MMTIKTNVTLPYNCPKDGVHYRVSSTRPYKPYRLIYQEEFATREEAIRKEKALKTTQGRRFLKSLL